MKQKKYVEESLEKFKNLNIRQTIPNTRNIYMYKLLPLQ